MPAKAKKNIQAATGSETTEKMACESIPAAESARKKRTARKTAAKDTDPVPVNTSQTSLSAALPENLLVIPLKLR